MASLVSSSEGSDLGVIGLAVMGENLVLNFESRGFRISVHNRSPDKVVNFMKGRAAGKKIHGFEDLESFVESLAKPRKVMLMVKAGPVVDGYIERLLPLLEQGDIIIDGGNSHYPDTERRTQELREKGILFIGTDKEAWPHVKELFQAIAAQVDGVPCCDWVGDGGAGHFVKMVHNGIEYGDIQLICEAYHLMKSILKLSNDEMAEIFESWNAKELESYLIEITSEILAFKDEEQKEVSKVDLILDTAGQKGTGKWTTVAALDLGIPVTLIGEAVFSRCLSALKEERVEASKLLSSPEVPEEFQGDRDAFLQDLRDGLFASKIVSYAQGFTLIQEASREFGWDIDMGSVALMWRGGCIIRSGFLNDIKSAFQKDRDLRNLLLDDFFRSQIARTQKGWRRVVAAGVQHGIPCPAMSSALTYFDGYRTARLPANLLQAQRDYFGAHNYERVDRARGEMFHTNWTGRGGTTVSSAYQV